MAVGDQRARHRPHGVDEEIAGRAIEALWSRKEEFVRLHRV
jgi:hypothetical protein